MIWTTQITHIHVQCHIFIISWGLKWYEFIQSCYRAVHIKERVRLSNWFFNCNLDFDFVYAYGHTNLTNYCDTCMFRDPILSKSCALRINFFSPPPIINSRHKRLHHKLFAMLKWLLSMLPVLRVCVNGREKDFFFFRSRSKLKVMH